MEKKQGIVDTFLYGRAGKRSLSTEYLFGHDVAMKEAKAGEEGFNDMGLIMRYSDKPLKNVKNDDMASIGAAGVIGGAAESVLCATGAILASNLIYGVDVPVETAALLHGIGAPFVAGGYLLNKYARVKDRVETVEREEI